MIARISVWLLIAIVLPDIYIYWRFFIRKGNLHWNHLLWWVPSVAMVAYTVALASVRDFAPADINVLYLYLLLVALIVVPKLLFTLCSLIGLALRKLCHAKANYGNLAGLAIGIVVWVVAIYGFTRGFEQVTVRHLTYSSPDIPEAFDGYKMVQFSDAHVGTYASWRQWVVEAFVDTIMRQHADIIIFTGDLQDIVPDEIRPHAHILGRLTAPDGVVAIMGNHDYPTYVNVDEKTKASYLWQTQQAMRNMGWQLLLNSHTAITRGNDSIIIAGMENDGDGIHFPQYGNVEQTLRGSLPGNMRGAPDSLSSRRDFVVMLQHDPTGWRRKIIPECNAQLTLSGHTHGGQVKIFGWSPASLAYSEWGGVYHEGDQTINVSTGVGGVVPFRIGIPGEICVITLKKT